MGFGYNSLFDFLRCLLASATKYGNFCIVGVVNDGYRLFHLPNKITGIEVKLFQADTEDSDRTWGLVKNCALPDYQVLLGVGVTGETSSTTEHNSFAAEWQSLDFPTAFDHKGIENDDYKPSIILEQGARNRFWNIRPKEEKLFSFQSEQKLTFVLIVIKEV